MQIKKVGVVGCGLMGSGIAQVSASFGYDTVVREVSQELLQKGLESIRNSLEKFLQKGKVTEADRAATLNRLQGTTRLEDLAGCDLVIEAVTENLEVKKETYVRLDPLCDRETIFASNTSSLSITEMMMTTQRPDRFIGLHFFNPVPLMALVEVVSTLVTSDEVKRTAVQFAKSLGKTPVLASDRPGFIVNRLLVPYLLDAIRALEEGLGTLEDIDQGMKLGCGHPMGPFTLLDLVGLDTTYFIANIMFEEFKEKRFAPPPLLKRMVLAGRLGRKSGIGFYKY
ncbi:MAG: 3-hydroxybutyryl-CoA dehydrogenase [Acidobacteria bacterium]|nr:3-hydroxybutyryl-CoA dehydrogenase [Acidobacteriota bacterium]